MDYFRPFGLAYRLGYIKSIEVDIMSFAREARTETYSFLRQLMSQTDGKIQIEDALAECDKAGIVADRSHIASSRNQYKRMKAAAMAAGEAMPVPPVIAPPIADKDTLATTEVAEVESSGEWWEKYIPSVDKTFNFSPVNKSMFDTAEYMSKTHTMQGKPSDRIRLVGPAGCGKTTAAIQFAAIHKRPLFIIDCPTLREPLDLFGTRNVEKMETVFTESMFVRAIETPRAVVVMDELNRVHPVVMNTALPLWDNRGELYLDLAKRTIKVAKGVTFFASCNEGREFTGIEEVDRAVKDRFSVVLQFSYLPIAEETELLVKRYSIGRELARKLCEVAEVNRTKYQSGTTFTQAISTRVLEKAAEYLVAGGDSTLHGTMINHFPCDGTVSSEKNSIIQLLKGKGFKV